MEAYMSTEKYALLLANSLRAQLRGDDMEEERALRALDAIWAQLNAVERQNARLLTRAVGLGTIRVDDLESVANVSINESKRVSTICSSIDQFKTRSPARAASKTTDAGANLRVALLA